jgi:hypothetical protein
MKETAFSDKGCSNLQLGNHSLKEKVVMAVDLLQSLSV